MNKVIFFILSLSSILLFYNGDVPHFSFRVYITSLIIQIFSIYIIFIDDKYPYSLKKIFFLFSYFFFGVAPIVQFYSRSSFYGGRELKEVEYFLMNTLLILIIIIYNFLYNKFFRQIQVHKIVVNKYNLNKATPKQVLILIFLSIFSLVTTFYFLDFDINKMFFRGLYGEEESGVASISSSSAMALMQTIRPISILCLMYYLSTPNRKIFISILLLIIAILTIFPTSVARFYAAAVYLPLVLISFKFTKIKNLFSLLFMSGLLFVFPFLNNFRYFDVNQKIKFEFEFDMFSSAHFDSYYNFSLILFEDLITYGRQLIGVLLFWVPRSVWENKPIGSGAFLAKEVNLIWENISANYFAEGFINFGFVGILLFLIIISYVTALIDKKYWKFFYREENNFFQVLYFIILSMLFFAMRGDLLSSTAFTVGFIVSYYFIFYVFTKLVRNNKKKLVRNNKKLYQKDRRWQSRV